VANLTEHYKEHL